MVNKYFNEFYCCWTVYAMVTGMAPDLRQQSESHAILND